jgi:hypothetical protein
MTAGEFRTLLEERTDFDLLPECLHADATPFVFETQPNSWEAFRNELVSGLAVDRNDIRVVGSGRLGFSLKPGRNFKLFSDDSDIDVVIVNAPLFDHLWLALLEAVYPRPPYPSRLGGWLKDRTNELYTGWLTPREIRLDIRIIGEKARPALQFKTLWFNSLKRASKYPPRRHEDVTGRLYRTWKHAELYHLNSIAALRKSLSNER